jgi:hypothetical protein
VGGHSEHGPPAHRHHHGQLAGHVNPAPILQVITAREAVAGLAADQFREQINALSQQLSVLETELADLATTRTTQLRLAGHPDDDQSADTRAGNPTYQQILAVLGTAEHPLRAKDICQALGIATTANHTESLRAKLKRLVARDVLTEDQPGLFAPAPTTASPADATVA